MKTKFILSIATLAAAASLSFGAQAETYDGVHSIVSSQSRAAVRAEAVATAHAPDQNVNAQGFSRVIRTASAYDAPVATSGRVVNRADVKAQAVATAHAKNQNLDSKAFYMSRVPDQYKW